LRSKAFVARLPSDDVAQVAMKRGYALSGDELLRVSSKNLDRIMVHKNDIPSEDN
jgi:hypothetical protein